MNNAALLTKFATLPTHLQAEVADFIDFLLHKSAKAAVGQGVSPTSEIPTVDVSRLTLERGSGKHVITYIADDFDAPMEDFQEYM